MCFFLNTYLFKDNGFVCKSEWIDFHGSCLEECYNPIQAFTIPFKVIGIILQVWEVSKPLVGASTWKCNNTIAYQSLCHVNSFLSWPSTIQFNIQTSACHTFAKFTKFCNWTITPWCTFQPIGMSPNHHCNNHNGWHWEELYHSGLINYCPSLLYSMCTWYFSHGKSDTQHQSSGISRGIWWCWWRYEYALKTWHYFHVIQSHVPSMSI